jgi:hypothetical protein
MLTNFKEIKWSDFNETEVDINELENFNSHEIWAIPHSKLICIVHCLCAMLRNKGVTHYMSKPLPQYAIESHELSLDLIDNFEYLDYCTKDRLQEIIYALINHDKFNL